MTAQSLRRRSGRAIGRTAFGAAIVAALLGVSAAPAFAHNSVIGTTPSAGAVVTAQPGLFSVTTSDSLEDFPQSTGMQISGPAGSDEPLYYGDGCATIFGPSVSASAELGQPGDYSVVWQAVSADGHTISGEFSFSWQPDANQSLATGATVPPNCGGVNAGTGKAPVVDTAAPTVPGTIGVPLADLLWIGGAVGAVVLATVVTLVLLGRRRPTPPSEPASSPTSESDASPRE